MPVLMYSGCTTCPQDQASTISAELCLQTQRHAHVAAVLCITPFKYSGTVMLYHWVYNCTE